METISRVLFWVGLVCIPLSWLMWFFGPEMEVGRQVLSKITDPTLHAVLQEAHAERLGIYVGLWPATLFALSFILKKRI